MQIDKTIFEKIKGPIAAGSSEVKVSLFVVSKTNPRLKKLDLAHLSSEKRAAKLHQWANDHRFVAVIQMGDQVFAHTHAKFAEKLGKQEDLSIDGKKVSVKVLTDEEAEQLSIVGEAFEDYVLHPKEEGEERQIETKDQPAGSRYNIPQYLARHRLVSDQMQMQYVIARMENILGQVVLECLRRIDEARQEQKKIKEADDKHHAIQDSEIKKSTQRTDIRNEDIKTYETRKRVK